MISFTEPEGFKPRFHIVSCYAEYDGKFVLLQRGAHKDHGGMWGLPAGKVEEGETIEEATARELGEETGIEVPTSALIYIGKLYVRNEKYDLIYHMYVVKLTELPQVVIEPECHDQFVWVTPKEALGMNLIHDLGDCIKVYYKDV